MIKRNNIAEYVLHLWQMEDYLRAFPEQADATQELSELNQMMHREGKMQQGHLSLADIALGEMQDLHQTLLEEDASYRALAFRLAPQLILLKAKTNNPTMSDVEASLVLLYQVMMLHLRKQTVSAETQQVQQLATTLLQYLSRTYYDNQTTI